MCEGWGTSELQSGLSGYPSEAVGDAGSFKNGGPGSVLALLQCIFTEAVSKLLLSKASILRGKAHRCRILMSCAAVM